MSIPAAWPQVPDFFGPPLVREPSPGQPSNDTGQFLIRPFDQRIKLTRANAGALAASLRSETYRAPPSRSDAWHPRRLL
jgi:hypothetical protein